ncbi:MAG: putative glycoside hydrolase [Atopococcus tabaci]|uniref:Glycoside hydrolase n=1 Tax=Atopococcus tabaci TaxID=269774 RepID=A0AA43UBK0_9LACT|nr:putative glycoside hydrolase [Atopococcus tabaci]
MNKKIISLAASALLLLQAGLPGQMAAAQESEGPLTMRSGPILQVPDEYPKKFVFDDGVDIPYPEDGVKGIYLTGSSAAGEAMEGLTQFVNETDLNAMVIDVKEDHGNILFDFESDHELIQSNTNPLMEAEDLIDHMEENQIYPIARIVAFKDTVLAEQHPEYSFRQADGSIWKDSNGEAFVSPYLKEVWDYNIEVAKEAAKMGFKEIQFDYVRFPEGFENMAGDLQFDMGDYADLEADESDYRVSAISDFVEYASEELKPYGVDVAVDIFGYTATIDEASGIGQNFLEISQHVDVISSMIYPSHWGPGHFDLPAPDLYPYELTDRYIQLEKETLNQLENPPTSRPWLQDFTASYLGAGMYMEYDAQAVEDQVRALSDNDIHEFLLWDASNQYTTGVDYAPESNDEEKETADSEESESSESQENE